MLLNKINPIHFGRPFSALLGHQGMGVKENSAPCCPIGMTVMLAIEEQICLSLVGFDVFLDKREALFVQQN